MTDSRSGTVHLREQGAVTELVLNRPDSLNSINSEMAADVQGALDRIREDSKCRCLVITGAGRGFCSGQALGNGSSGEKLPSDIAGFVRTTYTPIIQRIRALPIPVMAAVNGVAAGAGFSLALAADIRVASANAWFTCAFSKIGLIPDSGASWFLTQCVGYARAFELAVTGRRVTAEEAVRLGLVNLVFPDASFGAEYLRYAQELAAGPTRALGLTKQALNESFTQTLSQQLELEAQLQQRAADTHDFAEGLVAFREKRLPRFQGH